MTIPAKRHHVLLTYLAERGFASVKELGDRFSVSEMTIRRDLAELERQGLLQRTYGGAVATDTAFFEMSLKAKMAQFVEEKDRIGKAAADLVKQGETILLDSGSTTAQIATHLRNVQATVITNALNIASQVMNFARIELIIVGGSLRKESLCMVGPIADSSIRAVHADKLFLGVEAISISGGCSVPDLIEAQTKRIMIESADQVIVVADHSKLDRNSLTSIIPLEKVDILITGKEASEEFIEAIREHVDVLTV